MKSDSSPSPADLTRERGKSRLAPMHVAGNLLLRTERISSQVWYRIGKTITDRFSIHSSFNPHRTRSRPVARLPRKGWSHAWIEDRLSAVPGPDGRFSLPQVTAQALTPHHSKPFEVTKLKNESFSFGYLRWNLAIGWLAAARQRMPFPPEHKSSSLDHRLMINT